MNDLFRIAETEIGKQEIELRIFYLGYRGKIEERLGSELFRWLYDNYSIRVIQEYPYNYKIFYGTKYLIELTSRSKKHPIYTILSEILKLWRCKDGILSGPDYYYYYLNDEGWT